MKLVIKRHQPVRYTVILGISIVLMVVAGWLLLDYGQWRYIYERMAANKEQRELWAVNRQLEKEVNEGKERIAVLERANQIDKMASDEVQKSMKSQQDEILELKEELGFYREIVTDDNSGNGLSIKSLKIKSLRDPGHYRLKFVLTRVGKDAKVAQGTISLNLEGKRSGNTKQIALGELADSKFGKIDFEIRHFRRISREFALPDNFQPELLKVTVEQKRANKMTETYEWSKKLDSED